VLTVLARTRQAATLSFMSAPATGSATGRDGARPIEMHAYDTLRYIGDMLAWVHQAIAAEREFLGALLGVDAGPRKPGAVPPLHGADQWLGEITDAAIAGLCGLLRSHVLQTVRVVRRRALSAYKVVRLLQFYALTVRTLATLLGE
jgi:hypothetical protein